MAPAPADSAAARELMSLGFDEAAVLQALDAAGGARVTRTSPRSALQSAEATGEATGEMAGDATGDSSLQ